MAPITRRFVVVPADGRHLSGYDNQAGAEAAAEAHGDGTHVIDTQSAPYLPAVQKVEDGALVYVGHGSFDRRKGLDANLVEAAKKGGGAIVAAFLARGANPDAADGNGGTALIWAVAKGSLEAVDLLLAAGADPMRADAQGMTALELAEKKGLDAIIGRLRGARG